MFAPQTHLHRQAVTLARWHPEAAGMAMLRSWPALFSPRSRARGGAGSDMGRPKPPRGRQSTRQRSQSATTSSEF
eukprot:7380299-Alexandrium_andersonii.AAC.1